MCEVEQVEGVKCGLEPGHEAGYETFEIPERPQPDACSGDVAEPGWSPKEKKNGKKKTVSKIWCHFFLDPTMLRHGFDVNKKVIGHGGANTKRIFEKTGLFHPFSSFFFSLYWSLMLLELGGENRTLLFNQNVSPKIDIVVRCVRKLLQLSKFAGAKIRLRGRGSGHNEGERGEAPVPLMLAVQISAFGLLRLKEDQHEINRIGKKTIASESNKNHKTHAHTHIL